MPIRDLWQDPDDQELHVDGTVGVTPVERCQLEPWFVIAFYYPEKTTIEMGPTAVVSGTHLLEHVPVQNPSAADPVWRPVEKYLACEAGAVVLCDFRLVHKVRSGVWPQLPTAQTRSPCGRSLGSVRLRALIHAFARPFTLRIPPLPHTYPIHAETPSLHAHIPHSR